MNFREIEERIKSIFILDHYLTHHELYQEGGPGDDPIRFPNFVPPIERKLSDLFEQLKFFKVEVRNDFKRVLNEGNSHEIKFLNKYLQAILDQISDLKRWMDIDEEEMNNLFIDFNIKQPVDEFSFFLSKYPSCLDKPITVEFYENEYSNEIEENRLRASVYIKLMSNFVNDLKDISVVETQSFSLKNYENNKIHLRELFKYSKCADDQLDTFLNLFNGLNNFYPLKWIGNVEDLRAIVLTLHQAELLQNFSNRGGHWKKVVQCFRDKHGLEFATKNFANGQTSPKQKQIKVIINKMKSSNFIIDNL